MFQKDFGGIKLWQFEKLSGIAGIKHFVSGRDGGVSAGEKGGLNLSYKVEDQPENVARNRSILSQALEILESNLVIPVQTHSSRVGIVSKAGGEMQFDDTDALITAEKNICIAVMSADCVPVLLYDKVNKAAGAVHAGWRGTVGRIVTNTIHAMIKEYGTKTSDLVACIGPSICPEVYEVGEEVIAEFEKSFGEISSLVKPSVKGKGHVNLWEANRIQLLTEGVPSDAIEVAGICTYTNSKDFFSARKSAQSGRFAAGIVII